MRLFNSAGEKEKSKKTDFFSLCKINSYINYLVDGNEVFCDITRHKQS